MFQKDSVDAVIRRGLNPFFIRSVCVSAKLDTALELAYVLIPSSSGLSVFRDKEVT